MSDEQFKMIMQGLREINQDLTQLKQQMKSVVQEITDIKQEVADLKQELRDFKEQNAREHAEMHHIMERVYIEKVTRLEIDVEKIKFNLAI